MACRWELYELATDEEGARIFFDELASDYSDKFEDAFLYVPAKQMLRKKRYAGELYPEGPDGDGRIFVRAWLSTRAGYRRKLAVKYLEMLGFEKRRTVARKPDLKPRDPEWKRYRCCTSNTSATTKGSMDVTLQTSSFTSPTNRYSRFTET